MNAADVNNSGIDDSPPRGLHLRLRRSLGRGAFGHCYEAQVWLTNPEDNSAHASSNDDRNACSNSDAADKCVSFTQQPAPATVNANPSKTTFNLRDAEGGPTDCLLMAAKVIWAEKYRQKRLLIENEAKISDFGLACSIEQCKTEKMRICGTPNYLAPEVFLHEGHSPASDLWAVGATICFMITTGPPFVPSPTTSAMPPNVAAPELTFHASPSSVPTRGVTSGQTDDAEHRSRSVRGIFRAVLLGEYKVPVDNATAAAVTVVRGLLRRLPEERLTPKDILALDLCRLPEKISSSDAASATKIHQFSSMLSAYRLQKVDFPRAQQFAASCQLAASYSTATVFETGCRPTATPFEPAEVGELTGATEKFSTSCSSIAVFFENPEDGALDELCYLSVSASQPSLYGNAWLHAENSPDWSKRRLRCDQAKQISVLTGNMNILDIIDVLADRKLENHSSRLLSFWVSRWAVTNKATLFYTLEEVVTPAEKSGDSKIRIKELLGATSTAGKGKVLHEDNNVTEFCQSRGENGEQTESHHRVLSNTHVRKQCSRLQRRLRRFQPCLKVIGRDGYEAQPAESTSSPSSSSSLFVQRWSVWKEGITLLFSNGAWQANFFLDHTKIIVFGRSGFVCSQLRARGRTLNSTLWFADISDWFLAHPQHALGLARPLSNFI
ncbi:polo-like kinase 3 [Sparganum proliferum]